MIDERKGREGSGGPHIEIWTAVISPGKRKPSLSYSVREGKAKTDGRQQWNKTQESSAASRITIRYSSKRRNQKTRADDHTNKMRHYWHEYMSVTNMTGGI